eukprot:gnl/MRDRNA2_/MRDRNA2_47503_c0_seq1.p1 gnl/MRDRNA2_/MRDRNA2_47503_c0~~gnl/MRDRNA2_/MRDRNA2_47503_c0_seq1.p1  ORF type:complete len:473 (+),score=106.62 gnl/MRDRNA2_/MRDRNA2_47503_c0_seq1:92-1510(+)
MDPRAKLLNMERFPPSTKVPVEWNHNTVTNLGNSNNSMWNADWQMRQSQQSHLQTQKDNLRNYQAAHRATERKVDATTKLSAHLQHRIQCTQQAISLSNQNLQALKAAMEAKIPPLQLCTWRMEQRSMRPQRELVRDPVEIALENEKETLVNAREQLQMACEKTDRMIQALSKSLDELEHDLHNKTHSLGIDDKCYGTQHRSWPHSGRQAAKLSTTMGGHAQEMDMAASATLGSMKGMNGTRDFGMNDTGRVDHAHTCTNIEQEEQRHHFTMGLMNTSADIERAAQKLREECQRLMQKTQRDCEIAKNNSENTLQKRIADTKDLRNKLSSTIEDTAKKIQKLRQCNDLTGLNLDSHLEPRDLYGTKSKLRATRLPRENIGDPVKTTLDKHATQLKNNFNHLTDTFNGEMTNLAELERMKAAMELDLKDKTTALQIDLKCKNQAMPEKGSSLVAMPLASTPPGGMDFSRRSAR